MDQKTYWDIITIESLNTGIPNYDQRRIEEAIPVEDRNGSVLRNRSGLQGYLGRVGYNFDSKYYIDATVRRDGSSKFGPGFKWGTFPAVGVAWRVSSEKFMENVFWLNDLKFRAGYGKTGNQETRDFAFLSIVNTNPAYPTGATGDGNGIVNQGIALGDFPILDTTWETVTSTNFGVDATILDNKLLITAEYFLRETEDILQEISIPQVIGALTRPVINLATVENKGFEFAFDYQDKFGEIGFNANLNFTAVQNEVTSLFNDLPQSLPGGGRVELGESIGFINGYKTDGILQTPAEVEAYLEQTTIPGNEAQLAPGDLRFQDLGGQPEEGATGAEAFRSFGADGEINNFDQVNIGNTIPGYYYGLNLNFDYKGFDLGFSFRGLGDVQRINQIRRTGESVSNIGPNYLTSILDSWTPTNPSTTLPRIVAEDPSGNNRLSDRFVEDADFFRLQNLQFGYSFNPDLLEQLGGATRFRVYTTLSNVFVVTPYTGLDPENDTTPFVLTMGLNLSF